MKVYLLSELSSFFFLSFIVHYFFLCVESVRKHPLFMNRSKKDH